MSLIVIFLVYIPNQPPRYYSPLSPARASMSSEEGRSLTFNRSAITNASRERYGISIVRAKMPDQSLLICGYCRTEMGTLSVTSIRVFNANEHHVAIISDRPNARLHPPPNFLSRLKLGFLNCAKIVRVLYCLIV